MKEMRDKTNVLVSEKTSFTLFHQNVQGLTIEKQLSLEAQLHDDLNHVAVLCLTEHWASEETINYISIANFECKACYCRSIMTKGGSCILVRSGVEVQEVLKFAILNEEQHFESSIVEIPNIDVVIICVYRTPGSNIKVFIKNVDLILEYYSTTKYTPVIVGDLNINFKTQAVNSELNILFHTYNLKPTIFSPTRITKTSSSTIDQVLINTELLSFQSNVLNTGFSDHEAQIVTLRNIKSSTKRLQQRIFKTVRDCSDGNNNYFNYLLSKEKWEDVYVNTNVNKICDAFLNTVCYYFHIKITGLYHKLKKL